METMKIKIIMFIGKFIIVPIHVTTFEVILGNGSS